MTFYLESSALGKTSQVALQLYLNLAAIALLPDVVCDGDQPQAVWFDMPQGGDKHLCLAGYFVALTF